MKRSAIFLAATLAVASCSSTTDPLTGKPQVNKTAAGAGIGAAVGAVAGLLIAKNKSGSDRRKAVLIGAGIGALTGGGIGAYQDRQEQELRQQLINSGVSVTRNGNTIILNMPSNVTFATGQDSLNPNFFQVLDSVAIVLNKYPKTLLDVDGHTDSVGDENSNQALSERRAVTVARYLNSRAVDSRRLQVIGFGETRPIADNASDAGRAANRRVELRISPLT
jgi:outer membrane protein OmpA-like peptidoglycan-associated protein